MYRNQGKFHLKRSMERNKWIHVSIVDHGSDKGFSVFYFGYKKQQSQKENGQSYSQGDGQVVIGKNTRVLPALWVITASYQLMN